MADYSRRFHLKRKDNPRYGYISASLLAASGSDGIPRLTFLDIGSSIGCLLKEISVATGLPKENLCGIDHGSVVKEEFYHSCCTYVDRDFSTGAEEVLRRGFDVIICQEVAEHIPNEYDGNIIATISQNLSDDGILLWSAATPGQRGRGHINLHPPYYWKRRLESIGLSKDDVKTDLYRAKMDSIVPDTLKKDMAIYRESTIFSLGNLV
jgi:2-polyprenyl-3-methyl-5-hydroxy-6-metoxy-1,4-benzoquinol methylase